VKLRLSFLDAVNGCNKDVKYETTVKDNQKKARGKKNGSVNMAKSVNIDIPAGVEEVSNFR
jgi:DnaJ-class molecular chaperone